MEFILKENYKIQEGEDHSHLWCIGKGIKEIKKGAPIRISLNFKQGEGEKVVARFALGITTLKHLSLSMLELPNSCIKSSWGADDVSIFCLTKKKFFYARSRLNDLVANQIIYCPLCGKKVKNQPGPRTPSTEFSKFEVKAKIPREKLVSIE